MNIHLAVLVLWCLTPLSTLFQLYHGVILIGGGNRSKITELPQVTDKLYHIVLYRVQNGMDGVRTCNFSGDRHRLHRQFVIYIYICSWLFISRKVTILDCFCALLKLYCQFLE